MPIPTTGTLHVPAPVFGRVHGLEVLPQWANAKPPLLDDHLCRGGRAVNRDGRLPMEVHGEADRLRVADRDDAGLRVLLERVGERHVLLRRDVLRGEHAHDRGGRRLRQREEHGVELHLVDATAEFLHLVGAGP